jgi:diacylglycerol kinase family enzyme
MRAYICHNPDAGIEDSHDKKAIKDALHLAGYDTNYHSTKKKSFARDLGKFRARDADILVIAGGDGTIGKVIRALKDRSVPIALMPLGTANNIGRAFGTAGLPHVLCESWHPREIIELDIGKAEGLWGSATFLETFGLGAMPRLMSEGDKDGTGLIGGAALAYGRKVLRKILKAASPFRVDITVDGRRVTKSVLGVEVMNIAYTGPALKLAPEAAPHDRMFDVVCFDARRRKAMMEWVRAPRGPPPASIYRGRDVSLRWRAAPQRLDDELKPAQTDEQTVHLSFEPKPVRILKCWLAPEPSSRSPVSKAWRKQSGRNRKRR